MSISNEFIKYKDRRQSKIEEITSQANEAIKKIETEYNENVSGMLIGELDNNYRKLENLSQKSKYSQEEIEAAKEIQNITKENSLLKKTLISSLKGNLKDLVTKGIPEIPKGQREIVSYIFSNESSCYIISPTKGDNKQCDLANNLEGLVEGVLNQNLVHHQELKVDSKSDQVLDGKSKKTKPNFAYEELNGYLVWEIKDSEKDPESLKRYLVRKFSNEHVRPKEFKNLGVLHRLEEIPKEVFEAFKNSEVLNIEKELEKKYFEVCENAGKKFTRTQLAQEGHSSLYLEIRNYEKNQGAKVEFLGKAPTGRSKKENSPIKELEKEYRELSKKAGHSLTRTDLNKKNRPLYDKIRKFEKEENGGERLDFFED
ncbi:MAG: hypothetical protein KC516_02540 [Nanoarchaeota archaeon]|nr:hypothetical protein [Nanoarchaeota archaeon]